MPDAVKEDRFRPLIGVIISNEKMLSVIIMGILVSVPLSGVSFLIMKTSPQRVSLEGFRPLIGVIISNFILASSDVSFIKSVSVPLSGLSFLM